MPVHRGRARCYREAWEETAASGSRMAGRRRRSPVAEPRCGGRSSRRRRAHRPRPRSPWCPSAGPQRRHAPPTCRSPESRTRPRPRKAPRRSAAPPTTPLSPPARPRAHRRLPAGERRSGQSAPAVGSWSVGGTVVDVVAAAAAAPSDHLGPGPGDHRAGLGSDRDSAQPPPAIRRGLVADLPETAPHAALPAASRWRGRRRPAGPQRRVHWELQPGSRGRVVRRTGPGVPRRGGDEHSAASQLAFVIAERSSNARARDANI